MKNLEARFNRGAEVLDYFDPARAEVSRPARAFRANVDFPQWMVDRLDAEAARLGVTRQSLIKLWLAERLERSGTVAAK
jgi:hypothetical protein